MRSNTAPQPTTPDATSERPSPAVEAFIDLCAQIALRVIREEQQGRDAAA